MNRRQCLAALSGGLGGLCGCVSDDEVTPSGAEDPARSTETERTPTAVTTATDTPESAGTDDSVTVEDIVVRKAITYETYLGPSGVRTAPDTQYVVASIGDADEKEALRFETDDGTWEAGLPGRDQLSTRTVAGHSEPYLVFAVPSPLSASNPRIRHRETEREWPVPESQRATFSAPSPAFELVSLTAPDRVEQYEEFSVSLTVRNVSETAGRFLGRFRWPTRVFDDDEGHIVGASVAPDETATVSERLYAANAPGTVTLRVGGHVSSSPAVTVEESGQST